MPDHTYNQGNAEHPPALPPRPSRTSAHDGWSSTQDNADLPLLDLKSPAHVQTKSSFADSINDSSFTNIKIASSTQKSFVLQDDDPRYRPREKVELPSEGLLPPRVLHKTRTFVGRDFGYWREVCNSKIMLLSIEAKAESYILYSLPVIS